MPPVAKKKRETATDAKERSSATKRRKKLEEDLTTTDTKDLSNAKKRRKKVEGNVLTTTDPKLCSSVKKGWENVEEDGLTTTNTKDRVSVKRGRKTLEEAVVTSTDTKELLNVKKGHNKVEDVLAAVETNKHSSVTKRAKKVEEGDEKTKRKTKPPAKKKNFKSSPVQTPNLGTDEVNNMNIEQLLALGESSQTVDFSHSNMSDESSDMSDFEEVQNAEVTEPVIPKDGVNITLEMPNFHNKLKKKGIDLEGHLRRQLNKVKKDLQLLKHKVHLLCWIAHLRFVNNTLNTPSLMSVCVSLVKSKNLYPSKYADLDYLEGILKWFHKNFELKKDFEEPLCTGGLLKELSYQIEHKQAFSCRAYIFIFIILLRVLGLKARIVMSFQVVPVKPSLHELYDFIGKKKNQEAGTSKEEEKVTAKKMCEENKAFKDETNTKIKSESVGKKKGSKKDEKPENSDDEFESQHFKPSIKASKGKKTKAGTKEAGGKSKKSVKKEDIPSDSEEDDDFTLSSLKKKSSRKSERKSGSEEVESNKKKEGLDVWTEVYLEAEEKWISVDVPRQKIHCVGELYSRATHPVVYVIACNNDLTLKDVTKRYVPNWHADTRKKRVDEEWWNDTMKPYLPPKTAQDKEEDEDIGRQLSDKPLPASISEYKDHPLYVLKRHLLKFEAIYPPDAPTLGFVRGEPVYARECVHVLHSREMWYKQARVVRLKEEPYKIVKARPKYDKMTGEFKKDLPLELFGAWQTEEYIPPIATDGKVPRNEYGNVDLFKPCMLPIGTVHLQIPALIRVAKKLGIDCAPATVGFEYHSGGSHPVFDGFVVCQEFKEVLLDAWNKEIDESAKREEEKKEKRVWGNWRRLLRGLLIREKLRMKYAFGEGDDEENEPKASTAKASS